MRGASSPTNRQRLAAAVEALEPILDRIAFVGGVTTVLFIAREFDDLRATADVDVIVDSSYQDLTETEQLLRDRGFLPDPKVICRHKRGDLVVDLVPTDARVLGFSNRWYADALKQAEIHRVEGTEIKVISFPFFVATKLEAFNSRGNGDYLGSEDIEDLITVFAGRPGFLADLLAAKDDLREFIGSELGKLLQVPDFHDAVTGNFPRDPLLSIDRVLADLEELTTS